MAQKGFQLDQETMSCSICLDVLKDPVTTPCGHSYCMNCINDHWDEEDGRNIYSCPLCRERFSPRPVLGKNTMLAELVEELKKTGLRAAPADHCYAGPEDVACDSCTGRKLKAIKSCLVRLVSYCEKHLQPHLNGAAFRKHKLVEPCKNLQENICSRHGEVMKMFCRTDQQSICYLCSVEEHKGHDIVPAITERQRELEVSRSNIQQRIQDRQRGLEVIQQEITELKRKESELEQLSHSEDHQQFLHNYPSVSGTGDVSLSEPEPEPKTRAEFLRYSREITLDPNTANARLLLTEGNRKAEGTWGSPSYSSNPDRFTDYHQVLSRESLTGRCYWEVERKAGVFAVAVSYKSIRRVGNSRECVFGFNDKSWMLHCFTNSYVFYQNSVWTDVSGPRSSRIGVYLDHSAGILSFYSVSETMTLLHRVQITFTEPLYAGLGVYLQSTAEFSRLK